MSIVDVLGPARRLSLVPVLSLALMLALPASAAFAGRMMATGHDADFHCAPGPAASQACSFVSAAIGYVRGGAPNVTLPVLVIDRAPNQAAAALSNIGVPHAVVSPATIPATISANTYSAVVIASDASCGGCDLNAPAGLADTALINASAPALVGFFNDGGGLLVMSGAGNAAAFYDVLQLPSGGVPGAFAPFAPTPAGAAIGLTAANTNCNNCPTHNVFAAPAPWTVAETDAFGRATTIFAEGTIRPGPVLVAPAIAPDGLDHFKCYTVARTRARTRTVVLRDQFGRKRTRVREPRELCNPVDKTVRGRTTRARNRRAHLTCHRTSDVPAGVRTRSVRLRNQFGTVVTRTTRSQLLCVPSRKRIVPRRGRYRTPTGANPERVLDHLRCYGVRSVGAARTVLLRDQFGRTTTRVLRLVRLCNPVQKTRGRRTTRIRRQRAHLACYTIRDRRRLRPRSVAVRNQFDRRRRLRVQRTRTLCLPTFKQVLAVGGPVVRPAPRPVPVPTQFELRLTASACADRAGRLQHALRGVTVPARPGAVAVADLSLGGQPLGSSQFAALASDGTFAAGMSTPRAAGVYRWVATVFVADGGKQSAAVDHTVPAEPPRCPEPPPPPPPPGGEPRPGAGPT